MTQVRGLAGLKHHAKPRNWFPSRSQQFSHTIQEMQHQTTLGSLAVWSRERSREGKRTIL